MKNVAMLIDSPRELVSLMKWKKIAGLVIRLD